MTVQVVCDVLGLRTTRVHMLIDEGKLVPITQLPGKTGAYLFDPDDVANLAAERARAKALRELRGAPDAELA